MSERSEPSPGPGPGPGPGPDQGPDPRSAPPSPVVDVHAHVLIPQVDALVREQPGWAAQLELEARRNGPESLAVSRRMVGDALPRLTDLDVRLAEMDRQGVDVQVVSPSPSHYHYWTGPDLALTVCRTANADVAELVAARPDRLAGLGLVPLHHPGLCVEALEDAVLAHGLAGVEISSHAPAPDAAASGGTPCAGGVELSDPRLEAFWDRASQLGAIIFLHPFGCTLDERLDRFYLANTVGQPVENAVALSHLIFAGVLDRHPGLRIVAAHGGGYLPTYLGRSDHAWQVRPEARGCRYRPSSYLSQIWFDSLVHTPEALRRLVEVAGADRVLLGSDYPFDMGVADPLERLAAAALPQDQSAAVAGGNAAALGLAPRDGTADSSAALTPSRRP
jgi:aminocarboxymuconate-semialdehyde decarboxylase